MKQNLYGYVNTIRSHIARRPAAAFFAVLLVLLAVIVFGNFFRSPKSTEEAEVFPRKVRVFSPAEKPEITVQGKVEESGVVTVSAQTPAIVTRIDVREGQSVSYGARLVSLGNNYHGGVAAGVQRQIAQKNYEHISETFEIQTDLLEKQRDVARASDKNADALRNIANESIDGTNEVISINDAIEKTIESTIEQLEDTGINGSTESDILPLRQALSGVKSATLQLRNALRQAEHQASSEKPPAELSDLQLDITLGQIDLQRRGLELQKELSRLQLAAASVGESLFFPSSPVSGVIEKIHVVPNTSVNPGAPLVTIRTKGGAGRISAFIPGELAPFVSPDTTSRIEMGDRVFLVKPSYVSTVPTQGLLHTVAYEIKEDIAGLVVRGGYVPVTISLFGNCSDTTVCFVPIDAVHQTQSENTVYVAEDGEAVSRSVRIGPIIGQFVRITEGISQVDMIILDRNILDGDRVVFSLSD